MTTLEVVDIKSELAQIHYAIGVKGLFVFDKCRRLQLCCGIM